MHLRRGTFSKRRRKLELDLQQKRRPIGEWCYKNAPTRLKYYLYTTAVFTILCFHLLSYLYATGPTTVSSPTTNYMPPPPPLNDRTSPLLWRALSQNRNRFRCDKVTISGDTIGGT
ncbi:unnamed protein product, partial [Pylaiella littoralis]